MNADYQSLCLRLLRAIDSGNAEAEEHVLCQIRAALKAEKDLLESTLTPVPLENKTCTATQLT